MALSILDGNQSATTLSTILSSGQHITAHTVVSLGTQAITDMQSAISGSVVSISNLPATQPVSIASVTIGNTVTIAGTVTANPTGTQTIVGTVTANVPNIQVCTQGIFAQTSAIQTALGVINENNTSQVLAVFGSEAVEGDGTSAFVQVRNQISGTVTAGGLWFDGATNIPTPFKVGEEGELYTFSSLVSAIPAGTNRIGVVTIGGGTITIGVGTSQIGSVTASISNTAVTVYPAQGTTVTNSNFTSTTASTTLVSAVAGRECLTVFNEGAGNLHISAGATCTTISYQIRLSAGDYWECPQGQLSLAHTAVFATSGTARVTEVS